MLYCLWLLLKEYFENRLMKWINSRQPSKSVLLNNSILFFPHHVTVLSVMLSLPVLSYHRLRSKSAIFG